MRPGAAGPGAFAIGAAILLAAAALRIAGGWNDLWLDEIWALQVAPLAAAPLDAFTRIHHEINHPLYTLWLHAAGDRGNWLGYRVPSIAAGIATVAVAGAIGRRRGTAPAIGAMLTVGASYVLVLYSSEARGYAICMLCAFACFALLERHHASGGARAGAGYALVALPGLASHVLFASVLLSGLAWTIERGLRTALPAREIVRRVALCHAAPFAALALLWLVDIRHIAIGGGASSASWIDAYGTALAFSLGTPLDPRAQLVACLLAVAALVAGLRILRRERGDPRAFFLGAIVVFPVLLALMRGSDVLYPRHFLVAIAFLTLLGGLVLGSLWEQGERSAAAAGLAAYLAANGVHTVDLLRHGRGQQGSALALMVERTQGPVVSIGSDSDFRIQTSLDFFARTLPAAKPIAYHPSDRWPPGGPEWVVTHKEPLVPPIPNETLLQDGAGNRYELAGVFPAAPLSGLHWFVYHNVRAQPPAPR